MLWPFMRLGAPDAGHASKVLEDAGLNIGTLADPDARIPTLLGRQLLLAALEKSSDPALGLHAGERIESADFGVVHHAVRNCTDVRRALLCTARYLRLLDDNVVGSLLEEGERGTWQIENLVPRPLPAVNDFQVTVALMTINHFLGRRAKVLEVHVTHSVATDATEYARVFRAPVRFGTEHNALVVPREVLDAPVAHANRELFSVFDHRAQQLLDELAQSDSIAAKVRQLLVKHLDEGNVGIADSAHRLHMSAATLRRRLAEEGTTHKDLLEQIRREVALHQLHERRLSVGQIAFLLGFSSQSAFGRAFRRWVGTTPLEYRAQLRTSRPAS